MKKKLVRSLTVLFGIIFISLLLIGFLPKQSSRSPTEDKAFTTREIRTEITLGRDNRYTVTEHYDVFFNRPRHGLYRYIPQASALVTQRGQARYHALVSRESADAPLTAYNENGSRVIQLGDEDKTVSGRQQYTLHYTLDMGEDKFADGDVVYYNLTPTQWRTGVQTAKFRLELPEAVDETQITVYRGKSGEARTDGVHWQLNGAVLTGYAENLAPFEGLTLYAPVRDGYLQGRSPYRGSIIFMLCFAAAAAAGAGVLWFCLGRDKPFVRTVEFTAPDGIDPAMAGFLLDGHADDKDIISLLFYWADKGYIEIEETPRRSIKLHYKKRPDAMQDYEAVVFDRLFRGERKMIYLSRLRGSFRHTLDTAAALLEQHPRAGEISERRGKRIKWAALPASAALITALFLISISAASLRWAVLPCAITVIAGNIVLGCALSRKGVGRRKASAGHWEVFTARSSSAQLLCLALQAIVPFTAVQLMQYLYAEEPVGAVLFSAVLGLQLFYTKKLCDITDRIHTVQHPVREAALPTLVLTGCYAVYTAAALLRWRNYFWLTAAAVLGSIICLLFTLIMKQRTDESNRYIGRLTGLRKFICVAEKDRLEALAEKDPAYFYHILPYAYAMGVTDVWCSKFEGLRQEPKPRKRTAARSNDSPAYTPAPGERRLHSISGIQSLTESFTHAAPSSGTGAAGGSSGGGGYSGGGGGGGGGGSW